MFEDETRKAYEDTVRKRLVQKKYFTFGDALDDQVNLWDYGKSMFKVRMHNTYVPVQHTIMPRPNLTDGNDELGFRYNDPMDRSKP